MPLLVIWEIKANDKHTYTRFINGNMCSGFSSDNVMEWL